MQAAKIAISQIECHSQMKLLKMRTELLLRLLLMLLLQVLLQVQVHVMLLLRLLPNENAKSLAVENRGCCHREIADTRNYHTTVQKTTLQLLAWKAQPCHSN